MNNNTFTSTKKHMFSVFPYSPREHGDYTNLKILTRFLITKERPTPQKRDEPFHFVINDFQKLTF